MEMTPAEIGAPHQVPRPDDELAEFVADALDEFCFQAAGGRREEDPAPSFSVKEALIELAALSWFTACLDSNKEIVTGDIRLRFLQLNADRAFEAIFARRALRQK